MLVIPVIDVKAGVAVAASRGDRARYQSLSSPLAESADPAAVLQGFKKLFPFPVLYVADLDGIEGRGADHAMQRRLAEAWAGTELWIDDGSAGRVPDVAIAAARARTTYVVGSESLASLADYEAVRHQAGPSAPLSLDFRGDDFIGPPELLADAAHWPRRLIVMTLARVGSGEGPDLARLAAIVGRAGGREVYAAGGVRDEADLAALSGIGVAGALVATALHAGRITRQALEQHALA